MLKKQSTYCCNTTICFQIARESNYYGVGVLTQEDIKVPIYRVTFIIMEHLNRSFKICIRNLGANIQQSSIVRAGKCVAAVHSVCDKFEKQTLSHSYSMHHPIPEFGKDLAGVIKALDEESLFIPTRQRQHASFNIKCGLMEIFTTDQLCTKTEKTISHIYKK